MTGGGVGLIERSEGGPKMDEEDWEQTRLGGKDWMRNRLGEAH